MERLAPPIGPAALCVLAAAGSVSLPWLSSGLGSGARDFTGLEIGGITVFLGGVAVVALAALAYERIRHDGAGAMIALAAGGVLAFGSFAAIAMLEVASAAIPRDVLPVTIRRLTFEISAGPGPWLAGLSGLAVVLLLGLPRPAVLVDAIAILRRRGSVAVGALVTLVVCAAAVAWLRYLPWVEGSFATEKLDLEGWALPWVGPLSLVAVWMIVGAAISALLLRTHLSALLAACGGWLVSFLAALTIITAGAFGRLRIEERAPPELRDLAPKIDSGGAVWAVFVAGLLTAAAGAIIAGRTAGAREDLQWTRP